MNSIKKSVLMTALAVGIAGHTAKSQPNFDISLGYKKTTTTPEVCLEVGLENVSKKNLFTQVYLGQGIMQSETHGEQLFLSEYLGAKIIPFSNNKVSLGAGLEFKYCNLDSTYKTRTIDPSTYEIIRTENKKDISQTQIIPNLLVKYKFNNPHWRIDLNLGRAFPITTTINNKKVNVPSQLSAGMMTTYTFR